MSESKLVIDLGKITDKMKMKFTLVLESSNEKFSTNSIKFYNYGNSDYFKVSPRPLLSFEITQTNDKSDFCGFCVTKFLLARLIFELKEFIEVFKEEDLFYIDSNGELSIAKIKQSEHEKIIPVCSNRTICLTPSVIHVKDDGGTGRKDYEGCILYVDNRSMYTCLTYTELNFLLYSLEKVDFDGWSIQLMNTFKLYNKDIQKGSFNNTITMQSERTLEGRGFIMENHKEIPNLD